MRDSVRSHGCGFAESSDFEHNEAITQRLLEVAERSPYRTEPPVVGLVESGVDSRARPERAVADATMVSRAVEEDDSMGSIDSYGEMVVGTALKRKMMLVWGVGVLAIIARMVHVMNEVTMMVVC